MTDNVKIDMDALFNGASVVLGAAQNTVGAIANGINDVRGVMDSRRNMGQPTGNYGGGYQQPVSYGYGYSDSGGYYPTSNSYYPSQTMTNNGLNNYGGYPGFTNPGYGNISGIGSTSNRPQGGAWG